MCRATVSDFPGMQEQARKPESRRWRPRPGRFSLLFRRERQRKCKSLSVPGCWMTISTFLGYERFSVAKGLERGARLGYTTPAWVIEPCQRREDPLPDCRTRCLSILSAGTPVGFAKASDFSKVHPARYRIRVHPRVACKGKVRPNIASWACNLTGCIRMWLTISPHVAAHVESGTRGLRLHRPQHLGKELEQVLQVLPRDDLFQMSKQQTERKRAEHRADQERTQIRVFLRSGNYGGGFYYLPGPNITAGYVLP